jgi:hypothetical protein
MKSVVLAPQLEELRSTDGRVRLADFKKEIGRTRRPKPAFHRKEESSATTKCPDPQVSYPYRPS